MTKEEILEMSRKENDGMDEREKLFNVKAHNTAGAVSLLLGCLIAMVNIIADGPDIVGNALGAVYFCYYSVNHGMRARFEDKKFDWFLCVFFALVCITEILSFITGVLG